jgi:hypothetical protein
LPLTVYVASVPLTVTELTPVPAGIAFNAKLPGPAGWLLNVSVTVTAVLLSVLLKPKLPLRLAKLPSARLTLSARTSCTLAVPVERKSSATSCPPALTFRGFPVASPSSVTGVPVVFTRTATVPSRLRPLIPTNATVPCAVNA